MLTNPYQPPKETNDPEKPNPKYAYPYRVYEWIVLVLLALLVIGLLLPLFSRT